MSWTHAVECGADWVINGDADEFFVFTGGTIPEALAGEPADVSRLIARRHDFVPYERPGEGAPPVEMVYRKSVSLNLAGQPLPPKTIHRAARDVVVTQGIAMPRACSSRRRPATAPSSSFTTRSGPSHSSKAKW